MTTRVRILGITAMLVATAAVGATPGIVKAGNLATPTAQAPDVQANQPGGYYIAHVTYYAPPGQQTHGTATCPATKKGAATYPLGGGVIGYASINSSYPSGTSWAADVNNNTVNATFGITVLAVCAKPHAHYQVVTNSVANPSGSRSSVTAACPRGTKVTGGGGLNSLPDLAVNISSSFPSGNGWRTDADNASASSSTLTSYALCSSGWSASNGYHVAIGSAVTNPAGSVTAATVTCASGQWGLGGGGFSDSSSTSVNMTSTYPFNRVFGSSVLSGWEADENNTSGADASLVAYVICAT